MRGTRGAINRRRCLGWWAYRRRLLDQAHAFQQRSYAGTITNIVAASDATSGQPGWWDWWLGGRE